METAEFELEPEVEVEGSKKLEQIFEYIVDSGGKRVRPRLCLIVASAFGGDLEKARVCATSVELYHNFTLVHDDIQDDDPMRRGQPSVWNRFDEDQAITAGDYVHSLAYSEILRSEALDDEEKSELLDLMVSADRDVVEGQAMDIEFRERDSISQEEYENMARKKTGALIRAAVQMGAEVAEVSDQKKSRLSEFAEKIGLAFQIRDDVLDLEGGKGRKAGQDIAEGKKSLVVVKAIERLDEEELGQLLEILDEPKSTTTDEQIERGIEILEESGAIENASQRASTLVSESKSILDEVDQDRRLEELREFTEYLVDRKF